MLGELGNSGNKGALCYRRLCLDQVEQRNIPLKIPPLFLFVSNGKGTKGLIWRANNELTPITARANRRWGEQSIQQGGINQNFMRVNHARGHSVYLADCFTGSGGSFPTAIAHSCELHGIARQLAPLLAFRWRPSTHR